MIYKELRFILRKGIFQRWKPQAKHGNWKCERNCSVTKQGGSSIQGTIIIKNLQRMDEIPDVEYDLSDFFHPVGLSFMVNSRMINNKHKHRNRFYGPPTNCSDLLNKLLGFTWNGFDLVKPDTKNANISKLETVCWALNHEMIFIPSLLDKYVSSLFKKRIYEQFQWNLLLRSGFKEKRQFFSSGKINTWWCKRSSTADTCGCNWLSNYHNYWLNFVAQLI